VDYINDNKQKDQILVKKVLKGDSKAFTTIIRNTEVLVSQIVFKLIPNREDRRDIAQDVYLKAFQNLKSFRFQSKLSTWIAQIAYNTCLNFLEKRRPVLLNNYSDSHLSDDEAFERLSISNEIQYNESEKLIFQQQLSEILSIELEKLSPLYKLLITLFHNEELSYEEIAQITELPEGTVKNYLYRARKALKESILLNYKKEAL